MPNASYRRSAQREREIAAAFRASGFVAVRTPGSKGAFDVLAIKRDEPPRLIQVKTSTGDSSPWKGFGSADREKLAEAAKQAGGVALLYHYNGRAGLSVYPESAWPKRSQNGGAS